jgi:hypothetical protein
MVGEIGRGRQRDPDPVAADGGGVRPSQRARGHGRSRPITALQWESTASSDQSQPLNRKFPHKPACYSPSAGIDQTKQQLTVWLTV